jgi:hypothetical protein
VGQGNPKAFDITPTDVQIATLFDPFRTSENFGGTGAIEIVAKELKIVNKADVLPFQLDKELSNEDLRMKYRYLDLRRARMSKNIRQRSVITSAARRNSATTRFYSFVPTTAPNPALAARVRFAAPRPRSTKAARVHRSSPGVPV